MSAFNSFNHLEEQALKVHPRLAIVLGSGLATTSNTFQVLSTVEFSQIPGLTAPSVSGHPGRLTLCKWCGKSVLVFQGRLHFYEGHSWNAVTRPIHVAHSLGAQIFLATNAAGGIDPRLTPGSFMTIRDHLDWNNPFNERAGSVSERRMSESTYSSRLLDVIQHIAAVLKMELHSGIYAAVTGPNYETPAEIRALRFCKADAVGMSTLREIEAAHKLGMECAAISCITNRAAGLDQKAAIDHQQVIQTASDSSGRVTALLERFIETVA